LDVGFLLQPPEVKPEMVEFVEPQYLQVYRLSLAEPRKGTWFRPSGFLLQPPEVKPEMLEFVEPQYIQEYLF